MTRKCTEWVSFAFSHVYVFESCAVISRVAWWMRYYSLAVRAVRPNGRNQGFARNQSLRSCAQRSGSSARVLLGLKNNPIKKFPEKTTARKDTRLWYARCIQPSAPKGSEQLWRVTKCCAANMTCIGNAREIPTWKMQFPIQFVFPRTWERQGIAQNGFPLAPHTLVFFESCVFLDGIKK